MNRRTLILPIGAGVIGMDDVPLVRIMDSDETPTTITVYGVVDTVRPVESVTWTVNGVAQTGDVTKSPVLELTDLQPETSYAITLRATNMNGESQASTKTIWTKKVTTITPSDVLDGITYYDYQDVFQTGTIQSKDETDIVVSGRDVTVPAGYYDENETVSVSSDYIIPTGSVSITGNGPVDVTQYAGADVNVQPNLDTLNVTPSTSSQTLTPTGGIDGWDEVNVGPVGASIDQNIQAGNIKDGVTILGVTGTYDPQPNMTAINVVPTKQSQVITPTGGVDGFDEVNVSPVTALIDSNITPENIKKDVNILGVTGTFEGGITPTGTLIIVNNGTYDITNYASVNVNVTAGDFNELCFTANEAGSKVRMANNGSNRPVVYYSTDNKATWTLWDYSEITLANIGDKVYFYGDNLNGFSQNDNGTNSRFEAQGDVTLSGNIMTLITRYGDREKIPDGASFSNLFYAPNSSWRGITNAENFVLPVTDLSNITSQYNGQGVYCELFSNCTNLIKGPSTLQATVLGERCYEGMFNGCTSLTTVPTLPSTQLARWCYQSMFQGCTSLVTAPSILPATVLENDCYTSMFRGCTSLTTAPELPAKILTQYCYQGMFQGCTSLVTAPSILPATVLENDCYSNMFNGCTSLTVSPILSSPIGNYYNMFNGCTSLNSITVLATTWGSSTTWVNNVAATGTFYKPAILTIGTGTGQIPADSANGIPTGWTVVDIPYMSESNNIITFTIPTGWSVYYTTDGTVPTTSSSLYTHPIDCSQVGDVFTLNYLLTDGNVTLPVLSYDYVNMFYIEAAESNTVLNLDGVRPQYSFSPVKVQYSINKQSWVDIGTNTRTYTLTNTSDRVYFRKKTVDGDTWGVGNITVNSGSINIGGLLEYAVYQSVTGNRPDTGGCGNLFQNCTGLVDASDLKLFGSSYRNMFNGCTNLVGVPSVLPATTVVNDGYREMFRDCTSITTAPTIQATTVGANSCASMFRGCTSLTTAQSVLPATTLANYCYQSMFYGCTSLTTAPELPATTLSSFCYESMFFGCTDLTTAPPVLPAQVCANYAYQNMFNGCTSLTTSPVIYADRPVQNGFDYMFQGCTNLNYVTIHCTYWSKIESDNWMLNVAATGTFVKPAELVIGTGTGQIPANSANGIPTGWTVVDLAPSIQDCFCVEAVQPNARIQLAYPDTYTGYTLDLYVSTDNGTSFNSWDGIRTPITLANIGDKAYIYGDNPYFSKTETNRVRFSFSNSDVKISGDLTRLLSGGGLYTIPRMSFVKTFSGNTHLVDASGLLINATSIGDYAFESLFEGCTNLEHTPALPATTLGERCYFKMFKDCTSLTSAPSLPSTTLGKYCYSEMFSGCTGLLTAPALPATTLANGCYSRMFEGCTHITTSPVLSATTLVDSCYYDMFYKCTALNAVTCLATNVSASGCTYHWLMNVANSGTFTKNPNMSNWPTGIDGIPTGWTVVDAQ